MPGHADPLGYRRNFAPLFELAATGLMAGGRSGAAGFLSGAACVAAIAWRTFKHAGVAARSGLVDFPRVSLLYTRAALMALSALLLGVLAFSGRPPR